MTVVMEYELIDANDIISDHSTLPARQVPEKNEFNPFIEDAIRDKENSKETHENNDKELDRNELENNKQKDNELRNSKPAKKEGENAKEQNKEELVNNIEENTEETLSPEIILEYCKTAITNVISETEDIDKALTTQKESLGRVYDNIKFILLVNTLKRMKDLLGMFQKGNHKNKKCIMIYSLKKLKRVAELPEFDLDKDLLARKLELMKAYKKLVEKLKDYAFVLPGINKLQTVQDGIQYAVKIAKIGLNAERKDENSSTYYKFSLCVVNVLLDECYISVTKNNAIIPEDYCRIISIEEVNKKKSASINMRVVRMLLILRKLLRKRITAP